MTRASADAEMELSAPGNSSGNARPCTCLCSLSTVLLDGPFRVPLPNPIRGASTGSDLPGAILCDVYAVEVLERGLMFVSFNLPSGLTLPAAFALHPLRSVPGVLVRARCAADRLGRPWGVEDQCSTRIDRETLRNMRNDEIAVPCGGIITRNRTEPSIRAR